LAVDTRQRYVSSLNLFLYQMGNLSARSDTVITSFPQRWNKTEEKAEDPDPKNKSDIVETIIRHIGKKDRRPLTNVFDLAEMIVSKCVGTMFEHPDVANEKLRFAEFFEVSIGNVVSFDANLPIIFILTTIRPMKSQRCSKTLPTSLKDLPMKMEIS
jgi:hypothetical protein